MCKGGMDNVLSIKRILCIFEFVSGLKVNLSKCMLYGVNLSDAELTKYSGVLGCKMGSGHIVYLGMKIGINSHRKESWLWLVHRLKKLNLKMGR